MSSVSPNLGLSQWLHGNRQTLLTQNRRAYSIAQFQHSFILAHSCAALRFACGFLYHFMLTKDMLYDLYSVRPALAISAGADLAE